MVNDLAERIGQARFQRLADSVPVPTLIIAPDGRLLYANQQWSEAIGDRAGRSAGTARWTDAMDAQTRARATAALERATRGRVSFQLEMRLRSVDGMYRWWTCTFAPRYAPDGTVDSYVGACHDATATRQVRSALSEVTGKLVAAQEDERSRIARELHDDIGQQVALLSARLETLTTTRRNVTTEIADARSRLQKIASDLSSLSHELHPGKVKLLGLAKTLEGLVRDVARENGVRIDFDARQVPPDLSEETAISLFRVAQESLRNSVKHSGATAIVVRLSGTTSRLTLTVTDNGKGFDPLESQASGLGLLTMRERVELVGGTLAVKAARPHGTTVHVVVPLTLQAGRAAMLRSNAAAPEPASPPARATRRASAAPDPQSTAS
jgi:PAS domain S-box-containing protein